MRFILIGSEFGEWKYSRVLNEFGQEGAEKDVWSEWGMEMEGLRLEIAAIDGDSNEGEED